MCRQVNKTDTPRRMYVGNSLKANFRQQEIWTLSISPEALARASPKLLYRIGKHLRQPAPFLCGG